MGIRVACPNGHQLNVKDHLAGKRGICPHCQSRFEIPVGEPIINIAPLPAVTPRANPASSGVVQPSVTPRPQPRSAATPSISTQPMGMAAVPSVAPAPAAAPTPAPTAQPAIVINPMPVESPVAATPASEPIVAAPTAPLELVWYVRPATGGQYGPADQELMQQWITEGRVPSDALVWRTGWADWLRADVAADQLPGVLATAAGVQPRLDDRSMEIAVAPSLIHPTGNPAAQPTADSVAANATARLQRKRRAAARAQAWIAALLLIVALGLGIVLIMVLNNGGVIPLGTPPATTPEEDEAATETPPAPVTPPAADAAPAESEVEGEKESEAEVAEPAGG